MLSRRVVVFAPLVIGSIAYALLADPLLPIIQLELAGSYDDAWKVIGERDPQEFRDAIVADSVAFIPGYLLTLLLAAGRFGMRRPWRMVLLTGLAVFAGFCDYVENVYLWQGLEYGTDSDFEAAQMFAIVKFAAFVPAIPLALLSLASRRKAAENA